MRWPSWPWQVWQERSVETRTAIEQRFAERHHLALLGMLHLGGEFVPVRLVGDIGYERLDLGCGIAARGGERLLAQRRGVDALDRLHTPQMRDSASMTRSTSAK